MPWWGWLLVGLWAAGAVLAVAVSQAAALGDRHLVPQPGLGDRPETAAPLEAVVAEACAALGAERGILLLQAEEGSQEVTVVAEHGAGGALQGRRAPAQPDAADRLLADGQDRAPAVASAPVMAGARLRGWLAVASTDPERRIARRDRETLAALADRCAALLAGAQAGVPAAPRRTPSRREERARALAALAGDVAERLGQDAQGRTEVQLAAVLHGLGELRFWRAEASPEMPLTGAVAQLRAERWDGSGPHGMVGARIPLGSRILAACELWLDALADGDRRAAIAAVRREAGRRLDPAVAQALLAVVGAEPGRFRTARDAVRRRS